MSRVNCQTRLLRELFGGKYMFMSTHKQQLIQARHRASSGRRDDARPRVSDDALTPCPTRARRLFGALLRVVGSSAIVLVDASQVRAAAARRRAPAAHNTHILAGLACPALAGVDWMGGGVAHRAPQQTVCETGGGSRVRDMCVRCVVHSIHAIGPYCQHFRQTTISKKNTLIYANLQSTNS